MSYDAILKLGMVHGGKILQSLRESAYMTQVEFAAKAKVSVSLIQKAEAAERPKVSRAKFRQIAEAYGKTPHELQYLLNAGWPTIIIRDRDGNIEELPTGVSEILERAAGASGDTPAAWIVKMLGNTAANLPYDHGRVPPAPDESSPHASNSR